MSLSHIGLNEKLFWRLSLLAILLLVSVMSVVWWLDPVRAYQLRQEGAFFQNITVMMYLLASGIAFYFIYTRKPGLVYFMIPVFGVLFAGEELSWIERITEPPVIKGERIDALHDFVGVLFTRLHVPVWLIVVVGVALIVCVIMILVCWEGSFFKRHKPFAIVIISIIFIVAGQVVDNMDQKTHFQKYFFEELPENLGALLLLIAATAIAYQCHHPSKPYETTS